MEFERLFFLVFRNKYILQTILDRCRYNCPSYRYDELDFQCLVKMKRYDLIKEKVERKEPLRIYKCGRETILEFLEYCMDFDLFLMIFKQQRDNILGSISTLGNRILFTAMDHRWVEFLIEKKYITPSITQTRFSNPLEVKNYQLYKLLMKVSGKGQEPKLTFKTEREVQLCLKIFANPDIKVLDFETVVMIFGFGFQFSSDQSEFEQFLELLDSRKWSGTPLVYDIPPSKVLQEKHLDFLKSIVKYGYTRYINIHQKALLSVGSPDLFKYYKKYFVKEMEIVENQLSQPYGLKILRYMIDEAGMSPGINLKMLDLESVDWLRSRGFPVDNCLLPTQHEFLSSEAFWVSVFSQGTMFFDTLFKNIKLPTLSLEVAAYQGLDFVELVYSRHVDITSKAVMNSLKCDDSRMMTFFIRHARDLVLEALGSQAFILKIFSLDRKVVFEELLINFPTETIAAFNKFVNKASQVNVYVVGSWRMHQLIYQYNGNHQITLDQKYFSIILSRNDAKSLAYTTNQVERGKLDDLLSKRSYDTFLSTVLAHNCYPELIRLQFTTQDIKHILEALDKPSQDRFFFKMIICSLISKTPSIIQTFIELRYQSQFIPEILLSFGITTSKFTIDGFQVDLKSIDLLEVFQHFLYNNGFRMIEQLNQNDIPQIPSLEPSEPVQKIAFNFKIN